MISFILYVFGKVGKTYDLSISKVAPLILVFYNCRPNSCGCSLINPTCVCYHVKGEMFINRSKLPEALPASRRPAAWPLWRSPPADWDPMFPSLDTDLKAAHGDIIKKTRFHRLLPHEDVSKV